MKNQFAAFFMLTLYITACQTANREEQAIATGQASLPTVDSIQLTDYFPDTLLNRFEGEIEDFARQDSLTPAPKDAALFVGSSSIRKWTSLQADMEPLPVINRGFGGSTFPELLYYFDELVLPYQPRSIYVYEGDNDLAMAELNINPEKILETFQVFVNTVREKLPETESIYFISIKPSIARRNLWSQMQEANQLIKAYAAKEDGVHYVDAAATMLQNDGTIKPDIFEQDSLHMNKKGYALWTEVIRPDLMNDFAQH